MLYPLSLSCACTSDRHYRTAPQREDGPAAGAIPRCWPRTGLGSALWLAPTWRAAAEVRRRLLDGHASPGCFAPGVTTFERFAESVLEKVPEPIRPISRLMKHHLVRQLIEQARAAGQLQHFATIASTGGLVELACEWIGELKRLEIWPEDFERALPSRGATAKDRELLDLYQAYQQRLREHHLYDAEGRFWSARDWLKKTPGDGTPRPRLRLVVADGFTDFTRTQHEILDILAERVEEFHFAAAGAVAVGRCRGRAVRQAAQDAGRASPAARGHDGRGIAAAGAAGLAGDGPPGADALRQSPPCAAGRRHGGPGGPGRRPVRRAKSS